MGKKRHNLSFSIGDQLWPRWSEYTGGHSLSAGHREVSFEGGIQMKYKHGIVETRQISHSFVQPALIQASAVEQNLNKWITQFIHLEAVLFQSSRTDMYSLNTVPAHKNISFKNMLGHICPVKSIYMHYPGLFNAIPKMALYLSDNNSSAYNEK